jgi:hypothetical protein
MQILDFGFSIFKTKPRVLVGCGASHTSTGDRNYVSPCHYPHTIIMGFSVSSIDAGSAWQITNEICMTWPVQKIPRNDEAAGSGGGARDKLRLPTTSIQCSS